VSDHHEKDFRVKIVDLGYRGNLRQVTDYLHCRKGATESFTEHQEKHHREVTKTIMGAGKQCRKLRQCHESKHQDTVNGDRRGGGAEETQGRNIGEGMKSYWEGSRQRGRGQLCQGV